MTSRGAKLALFLCLFLFISIGAWAFSSPSGSSPDDDFHMGSIYCGTFASEDLCGKLDSPYNFPGGVVDSSICFAFQPNTNALCTETKLSGQGAKTNRLNQEGGGYPGGFYNFFSIFASKNVIETTLLIRLTNSLIFSILVAIILYQTRFRNKNTLSAILISLVPLALFIVPSTNPSSWTFIGGLTFPFFLLLYIKEGFKKSHLALALFSTILCLSARGDGGIPLIIGSIIVFGAILVNSNQWRNTELKTYLIILTLTAVSAFHFIYFSLIQKPLVEESVAGFNLQLFLLNLYNSPKLILGVFGSWGLGWLDTPIPIYVSVLLFSLAILNFYFNSLGLHRKYFLVFTLMILLIYPSVVLTTWGTTVGQYFQPRYLLPSVAAMCFAILYSLDLKIEREKINKLYRWNIVAAVFSYTICLYINILRYSVGLGTERGRILNRGDYWSFPFVNPWICFLFGTAFMVLAVLLADKLIREKSTSFFTNVITKRGTTS